MRRVARVASSVVRVGVLMLAFLSIHGAGPPAASAPIVRQAPAPTRPPGGPTALARFMTVRVARRSSVFPDTTVVYLNGRLDDGAPRRLSRALDGADGKIAVWLNSPGGNLFAGMQLGRVIRSHGASTHIIDSRTLLPGECVSACALAFLGGVQRFNGGGRYGVHRASLPVGSGERDLGDEFTAAVRAYIREMGVDARLLDLLTRAGPKVMYVLSPKEARELGVVTTNGGRPPG